MKKNFCVAINSSQNRFRIVLFAISRKDIKLGLRVRKTDDLNNVHFIGQAIENEPLPSFMEKRD